jgi:hypothetical protein
VTVLPEHIGLAVEMAVFVITAGEGVPLQGVGGLRITVTLSKKMSLRYWLTARKMI